MIGSLVTVFAAMQRAIQTRPAVIFYFLSHLKQIITTFVVMGLIHWSSWCVYINTYNDRSTSLGSQTHGTSPNTARSSVFFGRNPRTPYNCVVTIASPSLKSWLRYWLHRSLFKNSRTNICQNVDTVVPGLYSTDKSFSWGSLVTWPISSRVCLIVLIAGIYP